MLISGLEVDFDDDWKIGIGKGEWPESSPQESHHPESLICLRGSWARKFENNILE